MTDRKNITEITAPVAAGNAQTPIAVHFANEDQGGMKIFATNKERDDFTKAFPVRCYKSVAIVGQGENKFPSIYHWTGTQPDGSDGSWEFAGYYGGVVLADADGAIPKIRGTLVLGDDFEIQEAGDQGFGALIQLSDAIKQAIAKKQSGGQPGLGIHINGELVDTLLIEWPLQTDEFQGDTKLLVDPRAFEQQHSASCLLQIPTKKTVFTDRPNRLYMSHEVVPTGEYYSLNTNARGLNVQDNTGGDTAVTGGEMTRILTSVAFYGKATSDGVIKFWIWYKDPVTQMPGGVLSGVNGFPLLVEKHYNQGDSLSVPLILADAMMATGQAPIVVMLEASSGLSLVVDPSKTMLCVEQFNDGFETSIASIEFQRRLGVSLEARIEEFKPKMLSLKDELKSLNIPSGEVQKGMGYDFLNEFGLKNLTSIDVAVKNGIMSISAHEPDIADYYMDIYIDNSTTRMLRGKAIKFGVLIQNENDAINVEVYKNTGKPDNMSNVYDSRNNGSLVLNPGWVLVSSEFIAENVAQTFVEHDYTATIPDDANNIIIIVRPLQAQDPDTISLKDFWWGTDESKGYSEISRVNLHEDHLRFDRSYLEYSCDAGGYQKVQYQLHTKDSMPNGTNLPIGHFVKGKAPMVIDHTINQVSGSSLSDWDGGLKATADGQIGVSTSYTAFNVSDTDVKVSFWVVLIDADGNETVIPGSEKEFDLPANTSAGKEIPVPDANIMIETGQRIANRGSVAPDVGWKAYVGSVKVGQYMSQTIVEFDKAVTIP